MTRLFAIIVTYNRPEGLREALRSIFDQTRIPDTVVIVDNDGGGYASALVSELGTDAPVTIEVLEPGENLGPAGGTAEAMDWILTVSTNPDDWIIRFDDDKTVPFVDLVADLERFAKDQLAVDDTLGAVGVVGSRYDFGSGRLVRIPDDELIGAVDVDYVATNRFPLYRVEAIRATGGFDRRLFFGSSEVEFGLRLKRAGYRIVADSDSWKRFGRLSATRSGPRWRLGPWNWRRYYSLRNQIYFLRSFGHPLVAARVAIERGIAKPLVGMAVSPRLGLVHLRWNLRAIRDGWSGRLGRTVEPTDTDLPT